MQRNILGIAILILGIGLMLIGPMFAYYVTFNESSLYEMGEQENRFMWQSFFTIAGRWFLGGVLLIGVSEVIRLLVSINNHIYNDRKQTREKGKRMTDDESGYSQTTEREQTDMQEEWNLRPADEEKIYHIFNNEAILEMRPAPIKGYCVVKLQDKDSPINPYVKVIEVTETVAKEVRNAEIRKRVLEWYNAQ
ncbi:MULTISPECIES: hypothetical protein [Virgibacillus]|uniref:Uncharacterized protein n=1 Tax=Virgibacillus salarius TaxID=447199 RepID=A0A941ICP0_9BACI|nr:MULTISPECIES: hypothetical protein [Virgibacillus]MBR7796350.1 hypothetical protein [Virgibacillus salarius]MDY7044831.1 hypothetical protein [Virgibacillus sp. M23]NAZ09059.1 hypothetical protein [Agaribacter marinus]